MGVAGRRRGGLRRRDPAGGQPDDGDGTIDLCDIPDIVVVAFAALNGPAHIHVLDGETETLHYTFPDIPDVSFAPALGDIDGDGLSSGRAPASGRAPTSGPSP